MQNDPVYQATLSEVQRKKAEELVRRPCGEKLRLEAAMKVRGDKC